MNIAQQTINRLVTVRQKLDEGKVIQADRLLADIIEWLVTQAKGQS